MARNSLLCADVPLRNFSLTHSPGDVALRFVRYILNARYLRYHHIERFVAKGIVITVQI